MKKIRFFARSAFMIDDTSSERVTLQLRKYDADGVYDSEATEGKGNQTIWIQGADLAEVYEIVKSALMNSRHLHDRFMVE